MTDEDPNPPQAAASFLRDALRQEQLRLYQSNTLTSQLSAAVIAALLVAVMSGAVDAKRLVGWSLVVAVAIAVRVAVGMVHRRGQPANESLALWLWRYRLAVMGTGSAWGLAAMLLFVPGDLQHQVFLAFVLASFAAGSLTLTSFDPVGALSFAVLVLAPLGLRLLGSGEAVPASMAAMTGLLLAILAVTAIRAWRNVRETVALRIAESARADALKSSQSRLQELSAQLQRQGDALQLALDSMAQGILSFGADGRAGFHNRRLLELLDLPESLLADRPTIEQIWAYQIAQGHFGGGDVIELIDETGRLTIRHSLQHQPDVPDSYFRRTRDGRVLEVRSRRIPGGGLVRTFSDVTAYFEAQRRLGESQAQSRKLALVAAHTDNAVLILDPERGIEWVNEGFTRLTGYSLEDVVGRRPGDVLRGAGTDAIDAAHLDEQLRRDGRAAAEIINYTKDGRAYWAAIEMRAIVDGNGRIEQYISIERDISRRRQAEEALRAARDEAERANQAKSEFLSAMSHELRTPMNAILGFAQLLESDPSARLPARQAAQVHEILNAGRHLLELIDDVLDLSRIEAGQQQIAIAPVALHALVQECVLLMQPMAHQRQVQLRPAPLVVAEQHVAADRTRLKQVLLNLLSNAIKYNRVHGRVDIECKTRADGRVRIGVRDTGSGLRPEQCARLFTAFDRLGAETGAVPGAGIGLVLSKRLVESMQGTIGVVSRVGEGSTFWIEFAAFEPLRDGVRGPCLALPAPDRPDDAQAHRVLYIEDNAVNVLLMEGMLERERDLELHSASHPEAGLALARELRPGVILLDIQLPDIDGYEVLRRLRADAATSTIPVIAVSASAMPGDLEQGRNAGFDDYLTKPLDMSRLHTAIRHAMRASVAAA